MRHISSLLAATALLALVGGCEVHDPRLCFDKTHYRKMEAKWRARDSAAAVARELLRDELPRREAQWAAHRLSAYRLAVDLSCLCKPEPAVAVITAWEDSITVTDALGLPLRVDFSRWLGPAVGNVGFTVPKLFDEVRHGLADPTWTVEVKFDSTYGFPREVLKQKKVTDSMSDAQVEALLPFGYRAVVERFQPENSAKR